ncbi:SufD family Fe-S cluster assembly protein [Enterobacteriaceae endosymbiont of Donacia bicoloricornis]|uniref:SufD family Fe-S cluster assembly protein n=1 Tax=Enterobacteriaceae endosymbiont of Donacia bicoloricornis TaxID=2675772 RepID=UPI0014563F17|nr:SufD family Fe-S cluster assembly protein [Enterobacteriaceae endosymbiont of Donacia bicoloricornis]
MKNNIYKQIKNIYKSHKKYHFSKKSEFNWLKLKNILKNKLYDNNKKNFLKYINNNILINNQNLLISMNKLEKFLFKIDAITLCFINGKINKNISNLNNIYYDIDITKYNTINFKNINFQHNIYTYLSESLTKEIVTINIHNKTNINIKPIYLVYFNINNEKNKIFMSNYRNYIYLNNKYPLILIEHHININYLYLNNIYNTLILNNNVRLEYYQFITNENKNKNYYIMNNEFYLYNNVFFKKYDLLMSNKYIEQNNNFKFIGEKSKLVYKSISLAKNNNLVNLNNYVEHDEKNCCSIQKHKIITLDNSFINSIGLLKINKNAIKTDGQINYSSLLLSKSSKINIQPGLDILNHDVKCAHSVFTGKLDYNQIFFLRMRGISFKKAYNILLISFILDSLKEINFNNLKKEFLKKLLFYLSVENFFHEF